MARPPTPDAEPVLADLADRGYETTRLAGTDQPAAVATGGDPPGAVTDRPFSVEPLAVATPLEVVARLAAAATERRATLFVADPETAADAREILTEPFLRRPDAEECRAFYSIPDRIRLTDGTLAAAPADGPLCWREEPATPGVTGDGGDAPRLLLEADGDLLAALPSVDGLACPGPDPDAFPYRYARGTDRRIHVSDRDGEIGSLSSITAMKSDGYRPVPLPLVPEHHIRENAYLARRWAIAVVDDGDVSYRTA
ncbi:hypothetical protein I7X12_11695 [Halosimplex litoreum]|uniref:Uncharacterized protein n=1 Tax=Halosimplex litoreum TaxID=1198301 RepID=A0A7T3FVG2_9EURY|nr:hypothetical protein [Halosimplex litoreum]QPV61430.1 hypothetical protein I7X12_11695 [Halosimplex litoreum]